MEEGRKITSTFHLANMVKLFPDNDFQTKSYLFVVAFHLVVLRGGYRTPKKSCVRLLLIAVMMFSTGGIL